MAVAATPVASSASSSHDHPTWPSRGSAPNSGSSTARTKVTTRKVPSHASGPAGAGGTTKRPVARPPPSAAAPAGRGDPEGARPRGGGAPPGPPPGGGPAG